MVRHRCLTKPTAAAELEMVIRKSKLQLEAAPSKGGANHADQTPTVRMRRGRLEGRGGEQIETPGTQKTQLF
jgi:hypothetical protein